MFFLSPLTGFVINIKVCDLWNREICIPSTLNKETEKPYILETGWKNIQATESYNNKVMCYSKQKEFR